MSLLRRSTWSGYLIAIIAVVIGMGVSKLIMQVDHRFLQHGFFGVFLIGVTVTAWIGGIGPALFAIILSLIYAAWIFPPAGTFKIASADDFARAATFCVVAMIISSLQLARARIESKLQETERRLGFALESSGVGCWEADVKLGKFWRSTNLPELYGRNEQQFTTTYEGFFAYIHPEDRDFFKLASVQGGLVARTYEISHRIICEDGTVRRVHTRGRMYLDKEGKIERMVGAVYSTEPMRSEVIVHSTTQRLSSEPRDLAGLTGTTAGRKRPAPTGSQVNML